MSPDILVIDDDPLMRELVVEWLRLAGYRTRQAADAWSGLEQAAQARPALVITDICLPGHGATVINRIHRDHPGVAIIAVSGNFDAGCGLSARQALALGASRTFDKPLERRKVLDAVASLVGPAVAAASA